MLGLKNMCWARKTVVSEKMLGLNFLGYQELGPKNLLVQTFVVPKSDFMTKNHFLTLNDFLTTNHL